MLLVIILLACFMEFILQKSISKSIGSLELVNIGSVL